MEEFPGNSHNSREAARPSKPRVERVTQGTVVRRKRGLGRRFTETFVGGEPRSAGSFVMLEVLLPAMRDMVADVVSQGVERLVYGEARSTGRRTGFRPTGSHTPYRTMSSPSRFEQRPDPREPMSRRARANFDFQEIVLPTRVEADEVLDRLFNVIAEYEQATVRDLYDLVGERASFTDEKYGWTDIRTADVRRIREGYLLDLPRPELLR